ncbi:MAG: sodium:proton antiporter, partial [Prevotellaceae bacterium]|nr:sodium:proton antiporter [Prevotellaceae bacterium]
GIQLGVISDFIYPVIVAVSVITTFTTPYSIRYSDTVYYKVEKLIPKKWNKLVTGYAVGKRNAAVANEWSMLLQKLFTPVLIYTILSIAVLILSRTLIIPFITSHIPNIWGIISGAIISIIFMSPFLYGIIRRRHDAASIYLNLLMSNNYNKLILLPLNLIPKIICVILILSVLTPLFPQFKFILILVSILVIIFIAFNPKYEFQTKIESVFLKNLNNEHPEEK